MDKKTYQVWLVGKGQKMSVLHLDKTQATVIWWECIKQYKALGWKAIDTHRCPENLCKLVKDGELTCIGIINAEEPPVYKTAPHWLTRVPESKVSA